MISFGFKICLTGILLVFSSLKTHAQTETLGTVDFESNQENISQKLGGHFFFSSYLYGNYSIWKADLNSGTIDSLKTEINSLQSPQFSTSGMYYVSFEYASNGNSGYHYLNFIDTLGIQTAPVEINFDDFSDPNHYAPQYPTICNNLYYINGLYNNMHSIWESDGTVSGTHIIYQSNDPIAAIQEHNDSLFIAVDGVTDYKLNYYVAGQSPQQFTSISKSDFTTGFEKIGENDAHFYFNARDSLNAGFIYRSNFASIPEVFTDTYSNEIVFEGSSFFLNTSNQLLKGSLSSPLQRDTITFKAGVQSPSMKPDYSCGARYYRSRSFENGIELARLNAQDSLELIEIEGYGSNSSIPIHLNGFNYSNNFIQKPLFLEETNTSAYSILTNGNDTSFYMYHLSGLSGQSLFKIDHPGSVSQLFKYNGALYWIENLDDSFSLKRRSLNGPLEQQPIERPKEEAWFRQIAITELSDHYNSQFTRLNLQDAEFDLEGNSIVGFNIHRLMLSSQVISSDTSLLMNIKGSSVYAKYNEWGEIQWINGIGEPNGVGMSNNHFTLRENGNVVVLGQYFQEAYFDDDSLVSNRSGFYLAELDGNSGAVLWKKRIAEAYYVNDFQTDGITLDEFGNIYIAATYKGFGISIDGIWISSDKSPANVTSKFTPTGNVIWAKMIETPWLNYYGRTKAIDYSPDFQTLTVVQSQGAYNVWSSCEYHDWGYYIQELDPDGNIKNRFEIYSSDLGSISVGMRTPSNQFFTSGFFRGALSTASFELTTPPTANCNKNEGFNLMYDGSIGEIVSASVSKNNAFYPVDIASTDEFMYTIGANESDEMIILKYSKSGDYIGYKELYLNGYPFSSTRPYFAFDITEEYILIGGTNFGRNSGIGATPLNNVLPSLSVLKTENAGWVYDGEWMPKVPIVYEEIAELNIYPNPFTDQISVHFEGDELLYNSFQITDYNGRIVKRGTLTDQMFQVIPLNKLGPGMFLITFTGDTEVVTKKLLKL